MTNALLEKPQPGELWEAVKKDDIAAAAALFARGADANEENEECGVDLLMQASETCKPEMTQLLLAHGACYTFHRIASSRSLHPRVVVEDSMEKPAAGELVAAVNRNDEKKVEELLKRGADVDEQYIIVLGDKKVKMGDSLSCAAEKGFPDIVQLLINYGADINTMSHGTHTALMGAAFSGNTSVVRLLIDSGADVLLRDSIGSTAQHKARINNHTDIIDMLYEAEKSQRIREAYEASHNASSSSQQKLAGGANAYSIKRRPQP